MPRKTTVLKPMTFIWLAVPIRFPQSVMLSMSTMNSTSQNNYDHWGWRDAVKVDNDDDTSVGTVYLSNNTMTIKAGDDGIHASGTWLLIVVLQGWKINWRYRRKICDHQWWKYRCHATDDGVNAVMLMPVKVRFSSRWPGGTKRWGWRGWYRPNRF